MKTILLDCDGVVIDLAGAVHRFTERQLSRKVPPPAAWAEYDFAKAMQLSRSEWEFVYDSMRRKNKLGNLVLWYPQAQSFIEHLGFEHTVVFVTKPWRGLEHWVEARHRFLDHFLSRRNYEIVFTEHKHRIEGDWHIDDHWPTLAWRPERGILLDRPWNKDAQPQAAHVAKSYADILAIIEDPGINLADVATNGLVKNGKRKQATKHAQAKPTRTKTASAR